jgi:hypothetical protein
LFENEGGDFLPRCMVEFADGCIAVPESLAPTFVKQFHEGTHSGWSVLDTTLAQHFYVPKLFNLSKTVCERCSLCVKNNPQQGPRVPPQVQSVGGTCFEDLIVDFTEMPPARGHKYLLVFVCTFLGWVEAFLLRLRMPEKWPGAC